MELRIITSIFFTRHDMLRTFLVGAFTNIKKLIRIASGITLRRTFSSTIFFLREYKVMPFNVGSRFKMLFKYLNFIDLVHFNI